MSEKVLRAHRDLKDHFKDAVSDPIPSLDGIVTFYVDAEKIPEALEFIKNDPDGSFDMLTDVTAVDYLKKPEKGCRFEVVYHLVSTERNHRVRLKVALKDENFTVPTATGAYIGASWLEREIYDMFGISFTGHPDLRRILMWDGYEGHPLRKDFPVRGAHPVERTPNT